jgi:YD repeat-containing protein
VNGKVFSTTFTYDNNDNVTKITYPSSREVQYNYDAGNRITKAYAGSTTYADDLSYHPTGALHEATFGNGTSLSLTLDPRARPDHLVSGPLDLTYRYYDNGNVSAIDDARGWAYSSEFSYDTLDRLTAVTGFGATSFTYDALGNRATKGGGSLQVTYSYSSTTLRLSTASSSLGVPETGTFTYDAVGNMTGDGSGTYSYSARGTTVASSTINNATTRYQYDAGGLRALKSSPSGQSYYIHGPGGALLAEYAGSFSKEAPWAGTTGLQPDVTLTWGAVANATYEVCVDITNDQTCGGTWTSMGSATTTTLPDLPAGIYYWQVRATTTGGTAEADAGAWWSFAVTGEGVFGKAWPAGGASVMTADVTLIWNTLPDVGWWVCVDTTDNDTCDTWVPNGGSATKWCKACRPAPITGK